MNRETLIMVVVVVIVLAFIAWRYMEAQRIAAANTPGNRIGRGIGDLVGGIIDVAV